MLRRTPEAAAPRDGDRPMAELPYTERNAQPHLPHGSTGETEAALKCPREQLLILCVEANLCNDVVGSLLSCVTGQTFIPVDILVDRGIDTQWIGVLLDRERAKIDEHLVIQIEKHPAVLSAALIDHAGRSPLAPDGAVAGSFLALAALSGLSGQRRRQTILGNQVK